MKLGQYNNWTEATNTYVDSTEPKAPHIVANTLPADYSDISSIENWAKYGPGLVGTVAGFRDWKCLQREIKFIAFDIVDDDFNANWNNLNTNEKQITCNYLLSSVPPAKFGETFPDASDRLNVSINFDLNNRRARGNWQSGTGRVEIMRVYLFGKVGKMNALLTLQDAVQEGLLELYEGGIEGTLEDGIPGINDFILSRAGTEYETTGLASRGYPIVDGSSDTLATVASTLVDISTFGLY
jgi:hypothetical protein